MGRKAVWVRQDHFEYLESMGAYDGVKVPAAITRLSLILKRAGIENLTDLEKKLIVPDSQ